MAVEKPVAVLMARVDKAKMVKKVPLKVRRTLRGAGILARKDISVLSALIKLMLLMLLMTIGRRSPLRRERHIRRK